MFCYESVLMAFSDLPRCPLLLSFALHRANEVSRRLLPFRALVPSLLERSEPPPPPLA